MRRFKQALLHRGRAARSMAGLVERGADQWWRPVLRSQHGSVVANAFSTVYSLSDQRFHMRILHVLDHSIPLHSGYTFRTAALLREQRALGWETHHLTSPKQGASLSVHLKRWMAWAFTAHPLRRGVRQAGRWWVNGGRWQPPRGGLREVAAGSFGPTSFMLIRLCSTPFRRCGSVARLSIPVVYEIRAFWEDAAVDHGSTREGSVRYRATRALETRAIRRAAHVFTICEGLRADIVGAWGACVARSR